MALTKFKICPACQEHNPPALLECRGCETDLTGIKVVDAAVVAAAHASAQEAPTTSPARGLVKICDCGTESPPQARKCVACGEDLSDIRATEAPSSPQTMTKAVLRAMDDNFTFSLEKPVTIVGREADMRQYLQTKTYVSRQHAKLTIANGEIYIENMNSTNHTFVNNTLVPGDDPILLKDGDEIGLGGKRINGERQNRAAYFIIEVSA